MAAMLRSERAVEHALPSAERRIAAHDDERAVLVHGDVHQWNALQAPGGFKLVDPDGLLAEAEYDMGILMREDPVELLEGDPYERARRLANRTGLNPIAISQALLGTDRPRPGRVSSRCRLERVAQPARVAKPRIPPRPLIQAMPLSSTWTSCA
jgi:streptomycin 6-kinase